MAAYDNLPESFKRVAYHPSLFVYAWRRKDLEKLFEELNLSNIAISKMEVWLIEEGEVTLLIPLKNGQIKNFSHKVAKLKEEWPDFVGRSTKQVMDFINELNLEKNVLPGNSDKIYYNFEFLEE